MARLFAISLGAVKIMDCGHDIVASGFIRADGIDLVANHLQCLERDHRFVIFGKVRIAYTHALRCTQMNAVFYV